MNGFGQTVCLCMIVKNEDHVIRRCIASLLPLIDAWVIVDTGSTDGTQQTIRSLLQHLPGELVERPWVDFARNRTEALDLAQGRASYFLILDADEVLEFAPGFQFPTLEADAYDFVIRSGGLHYYKTQLVRDGVQWRYEGVLHEYITTDAPFSRARLAGIETLRIPDGARARDPLTYRKDALLLEGALLRDPQNARYMFYLAQSYADAGEPDLSIDRYRRRVAMGGWPEEVWFAQYQIARLMEGKHDDWPKVMEEHLAAFGIRQDRAEPLFRIGVHYQSLRQFAVAHLFLERAFRIPYPEADLLFVEREVYDYLIPLEYSVACFYIGQYAEATRISNRLLASAALQPHQREQVVQNRSFSLEAIYPRRNVEVELIVEPPVMVCILHRGNGADTQACVEAILAQDAPFQAVLVDASAVGDVHLADRYGDSRLRSLRVNPDATWAEMLDAGIDRSGPDRVVLVLDSTDVLTDPAALGDLALHYARYGCLLSYGQFAWSDGTPGDAYPMADADAFAAADDSTRLVPLSFRRHLWMEAWETGELTPHRLLQAAGHARVRFLDRLLVTRRTAP